LLLQSLFMHILTYIYAICSFIYACMSAVEMYMGTHVAF
jgi:hypothetical protein